MIDMTTAAIKFIVTPVVRPSHSDWLEEALADLEFRVTKEIANSDLPSDRFTVIARPADNKDRYRFAVYIGSRYEAASMRPKKRLDTHAVARLEVIEAVKAYLAAQ
jgi:hypothetical protein